MKTLNLSDRVLITGGTGLIGTNLQNRLKADGYDSVAVGSAYDLRDPDRARQLFEDVAPTFVFHLAAKVGGIYANSNYKADFYSDNVLINTHVVNECVRTGVRYVFAMGTGCAYPKRLEGEVLYEETFLDGIPEPTNDAYAYAKRGLLVHLDALKAAGQLDYCYCLPANIYGAHDNFHPTHSHVVPGLVRRFCEATQQGLDSVEIWGTGSAKRDFLYIDDCVDAMLCISKAGFSGPINVATGELTSIKALAEEIKRACGFPGDITHDLTKPEGQLERIFDGAKMTGLGWAPTFSFSEGIQRTVDWFNASEGRFAER